MDYSAIYNRLVLKARNRGIPEGYYEVHHIIPRSMGGSDHPSNLVELTAKEHYIAHMLLYKIHNHSEYGSAMVKAWFCMSTIGDRNNRYYSRTYELARLRYVESITGTKHPRHNPIVCRFEKQGEYFQGTSVEFYTKYGYYQGRVSALVNEKIKSMDGWRLIEKDGVSVAHKRYVYADTRGLLNGNANRTVYHFVHESGTVFSGTMAEFNGLYRSQKVDLSALVSKRQKISKGWKLCQKK